MEIHHRQQEDRELQKKRKSKPEEFRLQEYKHSDKSYSLITYQDRIILPKELQRKAAEWYHTHLLHQGETRMEFTIGQHYYWKGMQSTIAQVCKACNVGNSVWGDWVKWDQQGMLLQPARLILWPHPTSALLTYINQYYCCIQLPTHSCGWMDRNSTIHLIVPFFIR